MSLIRLLQSCAWDTHIIRFFYPIFSSSGLSVTCESGFSCEVFIVLHSNKDTGLTAGHVHSDAAPSTPRKNLRWIMACKPPSSQPLGEKTNEILPQVLLFCHWHKWNSSSQFIFTGTRQQYERRRILFSWALGLGLFLDRISTRKKKSTNPHVRLITQPATL